jgi:Na+-driven multidrug efflux pump
MSPPLPDATSAGARRRRILTLALPIIGGMVSQNVLNLVDAYMVGHLGDVSLAAVGAGGFLNFVTTAFILGVSAGVQAMSARRVGEGRVHETAVPLNGGLLLALGPRGALVAVPVSRRRRCCTPRSPPTRPWWTRACPTCAGAWWPWRRWP